MQRHDRESTGKIIAVGSSDVSLKTTDVEEKIISGILEAGEVNVVGLGDGSSWLVQR